MAHHVLPTVVAGSHEAHRATARGYEARQPNCGVAASHGRPCSASCRLCHYHWSRLEAVMLIAPIMLLPLLSTGGTRLIVLIVSRCKRCDEPCGLQLQAAAVAQLVQCVAWPTATSSGTSASGATSL